MSELLPELSERGEASNLTQDERVGSYEETFYDVPNSAAGDHIVVSLIDAGPFGTTMDADYSIVGSAQGIFWIEDDELVQKGRDLTPAMQQHTKVSDIASMVAA